MNASAVVIAILLAAAVAVELLCCVGLLVMPGVFDRLHFLGPAVLGPVLMAAAVLVRHSSAQGCIKAVLIALIVLAVNPVLTHVTARAARIRREGSLDVNGRGVRGMS